MVTAKQIIKSIKPNLKKALPQGPTQKGSAGYDNIRDDIEKIKNLREGTIEKVPANPKDIANKKYVDDQAAGVGGWTKTGTNVHLSTSTDNVGIGTTAPGELLTIGTEAGTTGTARKAIRINSGGFASPGAFNTASDGDKLILYDNTAAIYDARIGVGSTGNLWFKSVNNDGTGGDTEFYNGVVTSPKVVIKSTGNVGIGTTSPLATLDVEQTSTTGNTLWAYRNLAAADTNSPMVFIEQDNAGDDQDALIIQNDGTGRGLYINQNGNTGPSYLAALFIENTGNDDRGLMVYSGHTSSSRELVELQVSNAGYTGEVLEIYNAGTGDGIFIDQDGNGIGLNIDSEATTASGLVINLAGTGAALKLEQTQDVEVIDFDACTDGGTGNTDIAGSIKVQMPNGATGYINVYTAPA